jgi:hypothetical protein
MSGHFSELFSLFLAESKDSSFSLKGFEKQFRFIESGNSTENE